MWWFMTNENEFLTNVLLHLGYTQIGPATWIRVA